MDKRKRKSPVEWTDEEGRVHGYPKEWYGTWFRPGEPHGVPSFEAKVGAWRMLLQWAAKKDAEAAVAKQEVTA